MMTGVKTVLIRLKALREQNSLGQCVLAETLGVNRSTYVRKELGYIPITTEEWVKLARRMDVKTSYFFEAESSGVEDNEDSPHRALLALYRSLKVMEQRDLLTLIVIAFKGIKRKKVRENITRLREGPRG